MMNTKIKKILFPERKVFPKEPITTDANIPEFEDFITKVLDVPEEKFYLNALRSDPVYGRMTSQMKEELIADSIECGTAFANEALREEKDIYQLLKKEKIQLMNPKMPSGGGYVIFAQYTEEDNITVFEDSLDKFSELIKTTKYKNTFTKAQMKKILIAHEYFHYLEFRNEKTILTQNKKLMLWKFLGYKYMSKYISLSELSAMIFAKKYLDLQHSPFILDCLLTYAYNKEMSYAIYESVMDTGEE